MDGGPAVQIWGRAWHGLRVLISGGSRECSGGAEAPFFTHFCPLAPAPGGDGRDGKLASRVKLVLALSLPCSQIPSIRVGI